ncbi:hypothetical protein CVT24_003406, partial [Panaeolus cyanescens]
LARQKPTVFKLAVSYCGCGHNPTPRYIQLLRERLFPATLRRIRTAFTFEVLDTYYSLSLDSKITSYDYYHHILRRTDYLELGEQPSQLTNFQRAIQIWGHMLSLKRAGRIHEPSGALGTQPGELLTECPACPHPEKNLPTGWDADTAAAFLYTLFVAIDANFKLKQKDRGLDDVDLAPGWGAFVQQQPYMEHINRNLDEQEINTCNSEHDAIVRAATRSTPGYSVSGVGLVICSRHCLIRRNGAGDLQKGEKYSNMDFILFSALVGLALRQLVITYDIACQWSCRLETRMKELPQALHLSDKVNVRVGVPSWHINGHGKRCQEQFHVGYLPGVGCLCGDEIEQTWWQTNSLGASVREMAGSGRHQTLNAHWDSFNMRKIIGFRARFSRNLKQAVKMSRLLQDNFDSFSLTFKPDAIQEWEEMIIAWENDKKQPNQKESTTTLQDLRLKLAAEEAAEARSGNIMTNKMLMSTFLLTGLDIEEEQHELKDEASTLGKSTIREMADFQQKQNALSRRLAIWREVQKDYMPCVAKLRDAESNTEVPPVQDTKLCLPSSLPEPLRLSVNRLAINEAKAREIQADKALENIRSILRAKANLSSFKKLNLLGEGNKANTRARSLFDRLTKKVERAADQYRTARQALEALDGNGEWSTRLRELTDADLRPLGRASDETEGEWLEGTHKQSKKRDKARHLISWIWLVNNASTEDDEDDKVLDDTARVQWAKSRARAERWKEEVALIEEEMRRCVAYLAWKAQWWEAKASHRSGDSVPSILASGLRAYAMKQADYSRRLAGSCAVKWGPILKDHKLDDSWSHCYRPLTTARVDPKSSTHDEDGEVSDEASDEESKDSNDGSDEEWESEDSNDPQKRPDTDSDID